MGMNVGGATAIDADRVPAATSELGRNSRRRSGHPNWMMCVPLMPTYGADMVLRPLRRTPMMLGGVGFQVGLDEARRKQAAARQAAAEHDSAPTTADVIDQLERLKVLLDEGALTPEEFGLAKRKILGS